MQEKYLDGASSVKVGLCRLWHLPSWGKARWIASHPMGKARKRGWFIHRIWFRFFQPL